MKYQENTMYGEVFAVTLFVFAASFLLSLIISAGYFRQRKSSTMFWSCGLWLFSVSALLEVFFSAGYFSEAAIDSYLFLVALLVQLLSLGSISLLPSGKYLKPYAVYSIGTDVFLVYALAASSVGNIILNGVVYGALPVIVTVGSSLITFPAAAILLAVAALSYRKTHNRKLLSIIAGTIVVSAAGALYIAYFPAFLYVAELIGIVLLWIGFVDFSVFSRFVGVAKHVNG